MPPITSSALFAIALAMSLSRTPSEAFAKAAAFLICASAAMWARSRVEPEIGKFSTAL